MEHHHRHSTTHYLTWKLQYPSFQESFAWPPRSYSCSFCGREFRSAQALGGHMNIHRHDRARLKQSLQAEARYGLSESRRRSAKHAAGPRNECEYEDDDFVETNVVCKRHKLCCSSMEEIDLELRLGAPAR